MNAPAMTPVEILPRCLTNGSTRLGWVYCIRDDSSGAVKIGFSANPMRRFSQLQTGNPNELRLIGIIDTAEAFEQFMHWTYRARRLSGEWFDDADKSVSRVFSMMVCGDA